MKNLEESIELTVNGFNLELYDIVTLKENDRLIYRVLISSKKGVSLDECAQVSEMISPLLDLHEPLHGEYYLEVSSPGIERKLKKEQHFKASVGEKIRIKDIRKVILIGELKSADDNEITLFLFDSGEIRSVPYSEILSASTYYEWENRSLL